MANLNKVMLIGRLTRDPEIRVFGNGGKVAMFGFAVNNRKKNMQTGQWEDEPVFLDVEAFNRGDFSKQADLVEQYLRKGRQIFIDGHLKLDQWTSQEGQKRSRLKIVVDNIQFLDSQGGSGGDQRAMRSEPQYSAPQEFSPPQAYSPPMDEQPVFAEPTPGKEEDIPF
jgi:single-strand DNA-binding protein